MFGNPAPPAASTGMFGAPAATGGGSLFGGSSLRANAPTNNDGSLFGAAPKPNGGSLFGNAAPAQGGSLFNQNPTSIFGGQQSNMFAQQPSGNTLFG